MIWMSERNGFRKRNFLTFSSKHHTKVWSVTLLVALNNNMNASFEVLFKDAFPTNLSTIGFDVTQTDNNFFTAEVTFRYTLYEIRAVNSGKRRES